MKIREEHAIELHPTADRQESVLEAIAALDRQRERGELEWHAYAEKKRSLVRML